VSYVGIKADGAPFRQYVKLLNFDGRHRQKVLYLPLNSDEIQQTGMEDAFVGCGFSVCSFDYNRYHYRTNLPVDSELRTLVDEIRPDWIHIQLQFAKFLSPQTISSIKQSHPSTLVTMWTGDIRSDIDDAFAKFIPHIDCGLISNKGQCSAYSSAAGGKGKVEYWQIGYDHKFFFRESETVRESLHQAMNHDVCLCASWFPGFPGAVERRITAQLLEARFGDRFALYGSRWPAGSPKTRSYLNFFSQQKAYNGSKVVISINNFNDVEMYFSDRQLVAMASGTLTLSRYIPGMEKYFRNGEHTVWFSSPQECVDLAQYYLSHPDEALRIGKAGADIVSKEHTYLHRVEELCSKFGIGNVIKAKPVLEQGVCDVSDRPRISVAMCTYNRLVSLKAAVERTLSSGAGVGLEIIVNDGGSTDGTDKWLKEVSESDKRIRAILSGSLEGITAAYNRCFKMARGQYVVWLSDDTFPVGNAIKDLVSFMDSLGPLDMAGLPVSHDGTYEVSHINGILSPTIGCVRLSALQQMEYWNTDYPHYAQDNEMAARVWRCGGRVVTCHEGKIDHTNIYDELKQINVGKYVQEGRESKFYGIYRPIYGRRANFLYPAFVVDCAADTGVAANIVNSINSKFRNVIIHVTDKTNTAALYQVCGYIPVVSGADVAKYDFVITNDGVYVQHTGQRWTSPVF
jgi:glycosyltransferase involved in cell wall biosynthesis